MSRSRFNYLCITEDNEVKKYAAQSLAQIIDETDDDYITIIKQDLHSQYDTDYVELQWHD